MKKLLSMLVVFAMMFTMIASITVFAADASGTFADGAGNADALKWTYSGTTLTIGLNPDYAGATPSNGVIPNFANNTSTPWNAYKGTATALVVETGIKELGAHTFNGFNKATSVSLPEGLTRIGNQAFNNAQKVASFDLPSTLTTIESMAFANANSLASIKIPKSVTSVGANVFSTNVKISEIVIEDGSKLAIGKNVFTRAKNIRTVYIPEGVTLASDVKDLKDLFGPWYSTNGELNSNDTNYSTFAENITFYTRSTAFKAAVEKLTNTAVPAREYPNFVLMNTIGENGVAGEVKVGTGKGYWSIVDGQLDIYGTGVINNGGAFWHGNTNKAPWHDYLTSISKVVLHEGITGVNQYFLDSGAKSTHNVSVKLPSTLTTLNQLAFANNSGLSLDGGLPEGLTTIGNSAFDGCKKITGTLVIPASVTSIGNSSFANTVCSKVVFVGNTTDKALTIGNTAFAWNWNLTEVVIPRNVTSMGTQVFAYAGDKALTVTFEGAAPATLNAATMFALRTGANTLNYYAGNSGWDSITSASFTTGTGGSVTVNALPNKVNGTLTVTAMNNGVLTYRTNAALADQPYALIVAAYAADHTMVGVNFVKGTIKAGDNSQNKVIYVAPPAEETLSGTPEYYKVFLWDGFTNLEPVM